MRVLVTADLHYNIPNGGLRAQPFPMQGQVGPITVANVGSGYRMKRYRLIDLG